MKKWIRRGNLSCLFFIQLCNTDSLSWHFNFLPHMFKCFGRCHTREQRQWSLNSTYGDLCLCVVCVGRWECVCLWEREISHNSSQGTNQDNDPTCFFWSSNEFHIQCKILQLTLNITDFGIILFNVSRRIIRRRAMNCLSIEASTSQNQNADKLRKSQE